MGLVLDSRGETLVPEAEEVVAPNPVELRSLEGRELASLEPLPGDPLGGASDSAPLD